jgi:hypothetical protein
VRTTSKAGGDRRRRVVGHPPPTTSVPLALPDPWTRGPPRRSTQEPCGLTAPLRCGRLNACCKGIAAEPVGPQGPSCAAWCWLFPSGREPTRSGGTEPHGGFELSPKQRTTHQQVQASRPSGNWSIGFAPQCWGAHRYDFVACLPLAKSGVVTHTHYRIHPVLPLPTEFPYRNIRPGRRGRARPASASCRAIASESGRIHADHHGADGCRIPSWL